MSPIGSPFRAMSGSIIDLSTVIDDFEDGDISEYAGDTADWAATTTNPESGTYSGECTIAAGGTNYIISSHSGLNHYPEAGDSIEFHFYATDTDDLFGFGFGDQSSGDGISDAYRAEFQIGRDEVSILRNSSSAGDVVVALNTSVPLGTGQWYRAVLDWGAGGTITVTLYDSSGSQVVQISGTDTTFTSGGIYLRGYNFNRASTVYADSIKIV